jgi:hypothetical protein
LRGGNRDLRRETGRVVLAAPPTTLFSSRKVLVSK